MDNNQRQNVKLPAEISESSTDNANVKTNHQQQHNDIEEPKQKRQKPNECENSIQVIEPKAITNIYYDCLERIFEFLDLKSLLMMADTCKRLRIAAAAYFGDEHGKKEILLCSNWSAESEIVIIENGICVFGLGLCLPLLRCFGAKISDALVWDNAFSSLTEHHLDEYINEYCANTLKSIKFQNKSRFENKTFVKPFKCVEKTEMERCSVGNQLPNFVNWFPNVRHLKINNCSFDELSSMNVFFPLIEHLEVCIRGNPHPFRVQDSVDLLHANPQLQSLWFRLYSTAALPLSTILDTISANSVITKLIVEGFILSPVVNVNMYELNRFAVEHPMVVELILKKHRLTADNAINFIHQMNALKRIEFQVKDHPEYNRLQNQLNNGDWKSEVKTDHREFCVILNR